MRDRVLVAALQIAVVLIAVGHADGSGIEPARAPTAYPGQTPPGRVPGVFAPGVISDAGYRLHGPVVVSPDWGQICWSVIPPAIISMSLADSAWSLTP